ncbi:hypothetical protein SDRG_17270 [Saprolegnia diclina VS20]|uniref:Uncharacterized protein n=1 Tax=Saprolegnia diclina (strain VS20) TaxID=1156394 RepID=T0QYK9_SAPDV|nr:hypothetical protein SDRG_17270 [Saprolegnia diclina VS20]EQC24838.1 hypothetical protein SDRG_17270 [Saprolegnia diclina VS20]|eukprot:XP_008621732.1 hypothetical protein SDRG_17270 [Saprolegnia diclina VS20]
MTSIRRSFVPLVVASLWFVASVALSFHYLGVVQPLLASDLLWLDYNTTGYQAFVIDLLNQVLETAPDASTVDIGAVAIERSYALPVIETIVHPTYAMSLLTAKLTGLDYAIASLRNTTIEKLLSLPTQYCYVDFARVFEMAHTAERQARCNTQYTANGAVYLDAILRNTDGHVFLKAFGGPNSPLSVALLHDLEASTVGQLWLQAVASVATTVSQEAFLWQSHGITNFRYQWQNRHLPGLVETATLVNALGLIESVSLKSIAYSEGPGTSSVFSSAFSLGVEYAGHCNKSLLRSTSEHAWKGPCATLESYATKLPLTIQQTLLRNALGPFFTIDLYVVPPPRSLVSLATVLSATILDALDDTTAEAFHSIEALFATPTPPAWSMNDLVFYGGNPFCLDGATSNMYSLASFLTTDACLTPIGSYVFIDSRPMLMALALVNDSIDSICALSASMSDWCSSSLHQATVLHPKLHVDPHHVQAAMTALSSLNVGLVQFASDLNQTAWMLLVQPLLEPPFSFYGWTLLFEWVAGVRECARCLLSRTDSMNPP